MTNPHKPKFGENDTTELSIPIQAVPTRPILEEPPLDDEDTAKSLPILEESPIRDGDTPVSVSKNQNKPAFEEK